MTKYKWATPHAWLVEKALVMNEQQLRQTIMTIISGLDPDEIQNAFQHQMDEDGYFQTLVSCPDCHGGLEALCETCGGSGRVPELVTCQDCTDGYDDEGAKCVSCDGTTLVSEGEQA